MVAPGVNQHQVPDLCRILYGGKVLRHQNVLLFGALRILGPDIVLLHIVFLAGFLIGIDRLVERVQRGDADHSAFGTDGVDVSLAVQSVGIRLSLAVECGGFFTYAFSEPGQVLDDPGIILPAEEIRYAGWKNRLHLRTGQLVIPLDEDIPLIQHFERIVKQLVPFHLSPGTGNHSRQEQDQHQDCHRSPHIISLLGFPFIGLVLWFHSK